MLSWMLCGLFIFNSQNKNQYPLLMVWSPIYTMKLATVAIFWIFICLVVGGTSGFLTADAITNYYLTLNKPSWNPPNWIFGPVWTVLYIMMGIAYGIIWYKKPSRTLKGVMLLHLVLNFFWSIIFFRWQSPPWAFLEITCLAVTIAYLIFAFRKHSTWAAVLLIPYLCWVCFASFLNLTIWQLNWFSNKAKSVLTKT